MPRPFFSHPTTSENMPRTAKILITINKFRPLGVVPCTATYTLGENPDGIIAVRPEGSKNIFVKRADAEPEINIAFQVLKADYNFLGIAFSNASNDIGLTTFAKIEIANDGVYRVMTVHDARSSVTNYDYVIIVQHVESGIVGIIDPELDNTNET